uniref:DUF7046 domain-containing protein n=1 Tax=Nelumbo nucifera TaxID=4432 RepID=A0A822XBT6_NELNU|nr:TPA_asm: hypothetical protein HUJ06_019263 [Nelumbo nucifera]
MGELVRLFANDQKKITCDADMKREIDTHISVGRASFDVLFWLKDSWAPCNHLDQVAFLAYLSNENFIWLRSSFHFIDADMKREIDTHISVGRASFDVLFWNDSTNDWKPSTFILKRSSFQIKINGTADVFIEEKYSADLSIMIPPGLSTQFVLTCVHGTYPFSTYEDVRMRDTLVLTMRNFQSKALDDKRKGKA